MGFPLPVAVCAAAAIETSKGPVGLSVLSKSLFTFVLLKNEKGLAWRPLSECQFSFSVLTRLCSEHETRRVELSARRFSPKARSRRQGHSARRAAESSAPAAR